MVAEPRREEMEKENKNIYAKGDCVGMRGLLPVDGTRGSEAAYEAMGIKLGELLVEDSIFRLANLPVGWKLVSTDHSMWFELVDDKDRIRANVFYKASHDRDAFINLTPRFSLDGSSYYEERTVAVLDGKTVIHRVLWKKQADTTNSLTENLRANYKVKMAAVKMACAWLDKKYPQWRDRTAYWNE